MQTAGLVAAAGGAGFIMLLVASMQSAGAAPPFTALAATDDGNLLLGSQAGVQLRRWPGSELAGDLQTDLEHVHAAALAPDGSLLALAGGQPGQQGSLELFRWPERERIGQIDLHDDVMYAVDFSDDGTRIATAGGDHAVYCLQCPGLQVMQRLAGHSRPVLAVRFLPGGRQMVSAGADQSLRLWDAQTGALERTLDNHTGAVRALAVSPDRQLSLPLLATAGADATVRLWQPTIGRMVRFARLPADPLAVAWSPDGRLLAASCTDGQVRVIDAAQASVVHSAPALDGWAYEVLWLASSGIIVAGSDAQVAHVPWPAERK